MSLGIVFVVMLLGSVLALAGHVRFVYLLRRYEPELWQSYRRLAFTLEPSYWQHPKLVSAVYTRIASPRVQAARKVDLRCKYLFGFTSLAASAIFLATRLCPGLHTP